jgi:probable F420-dependent oxidoreductase
MHPEQSNKEGIMKLGITMFATDYAMRPDDLARACEERGFESVWFPEHTHIPASLRMPPPFGTKVPRYLWHLHDLFVTLTAAAAVTKTIKVGSGICLVIERDPIILAKEVASVDQLSGGRLLFGIGGGWNAEEMENHGTPFHRRWKVLRERIEAMKAIWTEEAAEYHGEFVNFEPIWSYPKPRQKPHPPIILGTLSTKGLHRVVRYCDGWIPTNVSMQELPQAIKDLHALAEQAGRKPSDISVSIFGVLGEEVVLRHYQELGVERVVFTVPSKEKDQILPLLDTYAALLPKFA